MKKVLLICLAVLAASACSKKNPGIEEGNQPAVSPGDPIAITVTLPRIEMLEVKSSLSQNASDGFVVTWNDGDRIQIGEDVFTISSFEGNVGKFNITVPVGNVYNIHYLPVEDAPETLVQLKDGDVGHLYYCASLEGVDAFEEVDFSYGWAAAHGGTLTQSAYLEIVLNMPESVSRISSVGIDFGDGASLELAISDGALSSNSFTAFLPCDNIMLDGAKEVQIKVLTPEGETYANSFVPGGQTLHGGYLYKLVTSSDMWLRKLEGKGSEEDPYLIGSAEDFANISSLLSENTFTCFRQIADVDFSGVETWLPINLHNAAYGIIFEGDGHKITNFSCSNGIWASLFGVLHGEVRNLTLEDARVSTTSLSPVGIVAAWAGNSNSTLHGTLNNVHVIRGTVENSSS